MATDGRLLEFGGKGVLCEQATNLHVPVKIHVLAAVVPRDGGHEGGLGARVVAGNDIVEEAPPWLHRLTARAGSVHLKRPKVRYEVMLEGGGGRGAGPLGREVLMPRDLRLVLEVDADQVGAVHDDANAAIRVHEHEHLCVVGPIRDG